MSFNDAVAVFLAKSSLLFLTAVGFIPLILLVGMSVGLPRHPLQTEFPSQSSTSVVLLRSAIIAAVWSTLQISIAVGLARMLFLPFSTGRRTDRAGLVIAVLPLCVPPVALALLWRTLLTAEGPIASWLSSVGIVMPPLLSTRPLSLRMEFSHVNWANVSAFVIDSWIWLPFLIVALVIAAARVSRDILDAARVDGAANGPLFWRIVMPNFAQWIPWLWLLRFVDTLRIHDVYWVLFRNHSSIEPFSVAVFGLSVGRFHYTEGAQTSLLSIAIATAALFVTWRVSQRLARGRGAATLTS